MSHQQNEHPSIAVGSIGISLRYRAESLQSLQRSLARVGMSPLADEVGTHADDLHKIADDLGALSNKLVHELVSSSQMATDNLFRGALAAITTKANQ